MTHVWLKLIVIRLMFSQVSVISRIMWSHFMRTIYKRVLNKNSWIILTLSYWIFVWPKMITWNSKLYLDWFYGTVADLSKQILFVKILSVTRVFGFAIWFGPWNLLFRSCSVHSSVTNTYWLFIKLNLICCFGKIVRFFFAKLLFLKSDIFCNVTSSHPL